MTTKTAKQRNFEQNSISNWYNIIREYLQVRLLLCNQPKEEARNTQADIFLTAIPPILRQSKQYITGFTPYDKEASIFFSALNYKDIDFMFEEEFPAKLTLDMLKDYHDFFIYLFQNISLNHVLDYYTYCSPKTKIFPCNPISCPISAYLQSLLVFDNLYTGRCNVYFDDNTEFPFSPKLTATIIDIDERFPRRIEILDIDVVNYFLGNINRLNEIK